MPIVVGFALPSEMEQCPFPYFRLFHTEAKNYGINKIRDRDVLYATYMPKEQYDRMDSSKWDNTYIMDERNLNDQYELGKL